MRELTFCHVPDPKIGYGRMGVELAKAMRTAGVDVYDDHPPPPGVPRRDGEQRIEDRRAKRTNTVCWASVPSHAHGWYDGQHTACLTMWEASILPETFQEAMHNFQTLIVPSPQNVELFSKYHPNVKLCPLGVDPAAWHYVPRRPSHHFDFLIGGSGARKGTDLAHKAFMALWGKDRSWGDGPIPRLVMKNPKREAFDGERVMIVGGHLSAEDEIALYASAHCYLQPSRGEGFGLQPLQAIAQGMPTILTGAHGHESFAHLGYPIGSTMAPSAYFIYGEAGDWWEPDFDELCDRMRWVYDHYDEALAHAAVGAATVAEQFTWADVAARFVDCFDGALDVPYEGCGDWIEPVIKRYPIITNRDWRCEVAGTAYKFTKGQEVYGYADVKRILYEANLLDPACISRDGADTGLLPSQIRMVGDYDERHAYCDECGQRRGSGRTKADDLFEQLEREAGDGVNA